MKKYTTNDISVMSVQFIQYSFRYYLESMKKCGINGIDFWGAEPHYYNHGDEKSKERLIEIKDLIDEYGMHVVVYTPETLAYPYSYSHPDDIVRDKTVEYMMRAIDDAKVLNCNQVFLNSGCGLRDLDREESFERLINSVKRIAMYAESQGVTLLLEQLQPYESNLVISLPDVKRVVDTVNSDALKVCVDVVAMEVANETLTDYFEMLGKEKISLIHFSDAHHYILGEGETKLPLVEYLQELSRNDYDGYIDLEINDSIYWLDPYDSIAKSKKWLDDNLHKSLAVE